MFDDTRHCPVLEFTEEEKLVQQSARRWAREVLLPKVRQMDKNSKYDPSLIQSLFEQGYMGMEIPDQFEGGSNLNFTSACLVIEEISRVDPSVGILVDIQNTLVNNALRFWGSPELQEEWLPRLATNTVSSFCLSEASSGSDAFSMKTTATFDQGSNKFRIRGSKLWISNAREAGVLLVFANAKPELGYKGITAFLVARETDGVQIGSPEQKLGLRASSTCPITFDGVCVDATAVLGQVGEGYKYCIEILNEGRIGIAAQQLGIAKGCLQDIVLPYVIHEREQFGTRLYDFQAIQHQIAMAATKLHAAELMTYNACRLKSAGLPFVKEASMAKYFASQVAEEIASKSVEWLGGIGFTEALLAEKFYRDCKVGSIYEGTSNIQLQTIAKMLKAEFS